MGHDTLMQADTAAYLVHNPGELGAAEPPETSVDSLFGSKMPWISTVTGKPGLSKDEDVHPVQNIGGVFTNSVFSVLGDIGVSDLYHFFRGMRQGPGRQYPVGYNPFYVDAMRPINDRFNGRMGAVIDMFKALKSKEEKKPEDVMTGIKKRRIQQALNSFDEYERGVTMGYDAALGIISDVRRRRGAPNIAAETIAVAKYLDTRLVKIAGSPVVYEAARRGAFAAVAGYTSDQIENLMIGPRMGALEQRVKTLGG